MEVASKVSFCLCHWKGWGQSQGLREAESVLAWASRKGLKEGVNVKKHVQIWTELLTENRASAAWPVPFKEQNDCVGSLKEALAVSEM